MYNEERSREYALGVLKNNVRSLDGEYDDENEVFFDIRLSDSGDDLVATVTDATDDSIAEQFRVRFSRI